MNRTELAREIGVEVSELCEALKNVGTRYEDTLPVLTKAREYLQNVLRSADIFKGESPLRICAEWDNVPPDDPSCRVYDEKMEKTYTYVSPQRRNRKEYRVVALDRLPLCMQRKCRVSGSWYPIHEFC